MRNRIPLSRGLGSSAAATIGGLLAGNTLLGGPLSPAELLKLATGIEGHADNAAAALLGGFVVVDCSADPPTAIRFNVPRDLKVVLFIPDVRLSTSTMRDLLPKKVPLEDAIANLGRVAIGVAGIASGTYEHLGALTQDRLHEQYRAAAYPQFPALVQAARDAGAAGACLSGAGSSVIAFCRLAGHPEPDRGCVHGRRGRPRRARPGGDRRTTQRRRQGRGERLMGGLIGNLGNGIGNVIGGAVHAVSGTIGSIINNTSQVVPGGFPIVAIVGFVVIALVASSA